MTPASYSASLVCFCVCNGGFYKRVRFPVPCETERDGTCEDLAAALGAGGEGRTHEPLGPRFWGRSRTLWSLRPAEASPGLLLAAAFPGQRLLPFLRFPGVGRGCCRLACAPSCVRDAGHRRLWLRGDRCWSPALDRATDRSTRAQRARAPRTPCQHAPFTKTRSTTRG